MFIASRSKASWGLAPGRSIEIPKAVEVTPTGELGLSTEKAAVVGTMTLFLPLEIAMIRIIQSLFLGTLVLALGLGTMGC